MGNTLILPYDVCGISAKMFIFGVGCPQMGCLGQIRMDCRDSTDVLQEIQSVCHVPNTSKYIWSNVVKNSLLKSSSTEG